MEKIVIIGDHPLANDLIRQYKARGKEVSVITNYRQPVKTLSDSISGCTELCLLSDINKGNPEEADNEAIALIGMLADALDEVQYQEQKLVCHLLVRSQQVLQMLHTTDFRETIRQKIDVYPFTLAETWSRSIVLDYEPITLQSEKHVHLVIFGLGEIAELVAIQAAYVAHYPNYIRNHSQRTRITIVDMQAEQKCKIFIQRFQHLFDNSYYRVVRPSEEKAVTLFHKPMYEGLREDFVDVEWEFVEAEVWNADLREKLKMWAEDKTQLLTVVMADNDENKNAAQALLLPQELYQHDIPIHKYSQEYKGYDVSLPLVRMAKNINYIYDRCYEENDATWNGEIRHSVEIDKAERERSWAKLKNVKRMSSICNAMTIAGKMRSIGLEDDDWDKFYDIPQQDIEILAQVEHNRWSVEELILGFRPCTDDEQDKISTDVKTQKNAYKSRKIHYDLRAYDELRPDGTGKPVQIYDFCLSSCLPLIAKAFADEEGGEA